MGQLLGLTLLTLHHILNISADDEVNRFSVIKK